MDDPHRAGYPPPVLPLSVLSVKITPEQITVESGSPLSVSRTV